MISVIARLVGDAASSGSESKGSASASSAASLHVTHSPGSAASSASNSDTAAGGGVASPLGCRLKAPATAPGVGGDGRGLILVRIGRRVAHGERAAAEIARRVGELELGCARGRFGLGNELVGGRRELVLGGAMRGVHRWCSAQVVGCRRQLVFGRGRPASSSGTASAPNPSDADGSWNSVCSAGSEHDLFRRCQAA